MVVSETKLEGLKLFRKGKVRDVYELGDGLLIVATDRVSAFDVVLPDPIPHKGEILNMISLFWFGYVRDVIENHLITADVDQYPGLPAAHKKMLKHRSVYVKKARPLPVECIVRGYITGSGWKEYQKTGSVCGIALEKGLVDASKISEPIFTPSTKADIGQHDENITFQKAVNIIGKETAEKLRDVSIEIYKRASEYALKKGIIIADTKFEFGVHDGKVILIDEVLTPDSSRFWPVEEYAPGKSPVSLDKQFIRNYLLSIDWESKTRIPNLPDDVIQGTYLKYKQAYEQLTGKAFVAEG